MATMHHASPTHAHLRSRPPIGGRATWWTRGQAAPRERRGENIPQHDGEGTPRSNREDETRPPLDAHAPTSPFSRTLFVLFHASSFFTLGYLLLAQPSPSHRLRFFILTRLHSRWCFHVSLLAFLSELAWKRILFLPFFSSSVFLSCLFASLWR